MAEPPRHPDTDLLPDVGSERESTAGTPWGTYVFVVVAIVLVLAFVLLHLTGVIGPGSH